MNFSTDTTRWLLMCLCVTLLLPLFAGALFAAPASNVAFLEAAGAMDWLSDRGHMIQLSLVIVALGIAVMWWYR